MPSKYDQQIREKAVRLVRDHVEDYPREWAAIKAVSGLLGMNAQTLRMWLRQAEVGAGQRPGMSSGTDTPMDVKPLTAVFPVER